MKTCYTTKGEEYYVDDEDYERVNKYTWHIEKAGYLMACTGKKTRVPSRLHRYVLQDVPKGMTVDYIDGNKLNNCKSNLRICTQQQNGWNTRPQKNGTSKYKGVSWLSANKKWLVQIGGNQEYLGLFTDEIEAAKAYNEAAKRRYGEYAWLNNV